MHRELGQDLACFDLVRKFSASPKATELLLSRDEAFLSALCARAREGGR